MWVLLRRTLVLLIKHQQEACTSCIFCILDSMKWLLFLIILVKANEVSAQRRFNIEVWKLKDELKDSLEILNKDHKGVLGSLSDTYKLNRMPNAFTRSLPAPKILGINSKGHNIYILPIDNMPMIKPDSTYASNMPTGYRR